MTTVTIKTELKKRMDLVHDKNFVKNCAIVAQKLGFTADEWNNNRAVICLMLANEVCKLMEQNSAS